MSASSVERWTLRELVVRTLGEQVRLELGHRVEVVRDVVLVAPQDDQHVIDARRHRLFDDVLDGRLVDDGQHLLRHRLGGGKEPRAETRSGDDGLDRRS
jgi:hypothetical protein